MNKVIERFWKRRAKRLDSRRCDSHGRKPGGQPGNDNAAKNHKKVAAKNNQNTHVPKDEINAYVGELKNRLVGEVASDGKKIEGIDAHIGIRGNQRAVYIRRVVETVKSGKSEKLAGGSIEFEKNGVIVYVDRNRILKSVKYVGNDRDRKRKSNKKR